MKSDSPRTLCLVVASLSVDKEREGEIIGENLRCNAPVIIYNIGGPCLLSRCCYRPFIKNAVAACFVQLNSRERVDCTAAFLLIIICALS